MRYIMTVITKFRLLFVVLLSFLSLTAMAQTKKTVAVLDPICRDNTVNAFFKQMVRGAMESAVTNSEEYEAYDRSAFDLIQKELAFQQSGVVNDLQIKKMGEMAGVDYVLVSEMSSYDGYISVVVKILNITTGKYDRAVDDYMQLNPEAVKKKCNEMVLVLFGVIPSDIVSSTGNSALKNEILIWTQDKNDVQYCDGKYEGREEYFFVDLDDYSFNRRHFRIVFSFEAQEFTSTDDYWKMQYPVMISEGWRVIGVSLRENGQIFIETNNGENEYATGLTYIPRQYKEIDLEYDNGLVTINGVKLKVNMNEYNGDNTLSSINYGRGIAFLGYIHSVRVYNIED